MAVSVLMKWGTPRGQFPVSKEKQRMHISSSAQAAWAELAHGQRAVVSLPGPASRVPPQQRGCPYRLAPPGARGAPSCSHRSMGSAHNWPLQCHLSGRGRNRTGRNECHRGREPKLIDAYTSGIYVSLVMRILSSNRNLEGGSFRAD